MESPEAYVTEVDGKLVLIDPVACAIIDESLCSKTLELKLDRVKHFINRIAELGTDPLEVTIVILNVDTQLGGFLANGLMPGHDWQQYRDRGEIPFAQGLAGREGIQAVLDKASPDEGTKLRKAESAITVVVVDHEVAEVFLVTQNT
jgi:hypothetical protein